MGHQGLHWKSFLNCIFHNMKATKEMQCSHIFTLGEKRWKTNNENRDKWNAVAKQKSNIAKLNSSNYAMLWSYVRHSSVFASNNSCSVFIFIRIRLSECMKIRRACTHAHFVQCFPDVLHLFSRLTAWLWRNRAVSNFCSLIFKALLPSSQLSAIKVRLVFVFDGCKFCVSHRRCFASFALLTRSQSLTAITIFRFVWYSVYHRPGAECCCYTNA